MYKLSIDKRVAWTRNIKCAAINILVVSARISSEISHGMSAGGSENDPLRGQEPGVEVPYRGVCRRAAAEREVWGSQTRVVRGRYWMSSRERLRALKEPSISLPLPVILPSPSTIVIPCASLFQLLLHPLPPPPLVIRSLYDVRRTFEASLSLPFQQLSRDGKNPPWHWREGQLSYPICPYFS